MLYRYAILAILLSLVLPAEARSARADRPEVPTTAIAPAVLDALGVATDLPGQDGLVFDRAPADPGAPSARR